MDLNCDVAEGMGNEAELMPWISSANIACGSHAGDEDLMKSTVDLCIAAKVSIGAHPSFPDRENFGRTNMLMPMNQIADVVHDQIMLLKRITDAAGVHLRHVKPHGALYNMAAKDPVLAGTLCDVLLAIDASLVFYGLSGSIMLTEARRRNLVVAHEVFADRSYQPDHSLTPRTASNALINDENKALAQALLFAREGKVMDIHGDVHPLKADTICLHGDGIRAVPMAKLIYTTLTENGIKIYAR